MPPTPRWMSIVGIGLGLLVGASGIFGCVTLFKAGEGVGFMAVVALIGIAGIVVGVRELIQPRT